MFDTRAFAAFKEGFRGDLVGPDDAGYDEARSLYNGMIDKRPRLIARCADVADVIAAVDFGRDQDLLIAVRGGGHNGPGLGSCDDGLVIDLSRLKGVRVDPAGRTVRVEAGCTQGDVDHAAGAFGLAVPAGIVASTGVAGLTLGGGHGYLSRAHGLTIDNLIEADVVLADGRLVTANERQNADLFWALRGGGGNFGVVRGIWPAAAYAEIAGAGHMSPLTHPERVNDVVEGFLHEHTRWTSAQSHAQKVPRLLGSAVTMAVHKRASAAR